MSGRVASDGRRINDSSFRRFTSLDWLLSIEFCIIHIPDSFAPRGIRWVVSGTTNEGRLTPADSLKFLPRWPSA